MKNTVFIHTNDKQILGALVASSLQMSIFLPVLTAVLADYPTAGMAAPYRSGRWLSTAPISATSDTQPM